MPASPTGSYDVRDVIRAIVDDGELLELRARLGRRTSSPRSPRSAAVPIGIVANQPMHLAGTLDIPASQKGARFVDFCDAFNLPLAHPRRHARLLSRQGPRVAGHDPPRRAARLRLRPGHGARVSRRPAQGLRRRVHRHGLASTMGNDLCLAWPSAEIAVMGAKGAVEILHRAATTPTSGWRSRPTTRSACSTRTSPPSAGSVDAVDRPGRHPPRAGRRARRPRRPSASASPPSARQHAPLIAPTTHQAGR